MSKTPPSRCPVFQPDHNGECRNCDEWIDAHDAHAVNIGQALAFFREHFKSRDDLGVDEQGQVIAIGDEARAASNAIVEDIRNEPVLMIARLDGVLGVRVFGKPSVDVADLLDGVAAQYRRVIALNKKASDDPTN